MRDDVAHVPLLLLPHGTCAYAALAAAAAPMTHVLLHYACAATAP